MVHFFKQLRSVIHKNWCSVKAETKSNRCLVLSRVDGNLFSNKTTLLDNNLQLQPLLSSKL
jgi:hypothetical protein